MELTDAAVGRFAAGRVFKDYKARINSLAFHRAQDLLATASDDDSIHLYNVHAGSQSKFVQSKKYGASHLCFTHAEDAVLHATTKVASKAENAVRYLSLHSNQYQRYFHGHTDEVTSVNLSPRSDTFLSAAKDFEVRLWDLRVPDCQGLLKCPGVPTAAYDEQGVVFCVATDAGILKLYDVRNPKQGPFSTFTIPDVANTALPLTGVSFTVDGNRLCAAAGPTLFVLDAFDGAVQHRFHTGAQEGAPPFQPAFSPTSTHITSGAPGGSSLQPPGLASAAPAMPGMPVLTTGCQDGLVRTWNLATGKQVAAWKVHAGAPTALAWAPRKALVASACSALVLWLPLPGG